MVHVNIFLWKASKQDRELVHRITSYLSDLVDDKFDATIEDLAVVEPRTDIEDPCISFGSMSAIHYATNGTKWILPEPDKLYPGKDNAETRQKAFELLKEIAATLNETNSNVVEEVSTCVEMPDGTTVGKEAADIQITEHEAAYLKQLRDMLSGSKIVLVKGDIRIEVE